MGFGEVLQERFAGSVPEADFLERTYAALEGHGFNRENTITSVGLCRDELCTPLAQQVMRQWGEAFTLRSLGAMLFAGKTGFLAAHAHAPTEHGRERYLYLTMPHIGIGPDGELGGCRRSGQLSESVACGALDAFRGALAKFDVSDRMDPDDPEQSMLKSRMLRKSSWGAAPDLAELTQVAYSVIREDLERLLTLTVDVAQADFAVLSGIQIHGPKGQNWIWPGSMYASVEGKRVDVTW